MSLGAGKDIKIRLRERSHITKARLAGGVDLKLTFAYGGERGVHGQTYVSIANLEITMN